MKSLIAQPVPVLSGIVRATNPKREFKYEVVAYEQTTCNYCGAGFTKTAIAHNLALRML
jgi:hypothetical protein